MKNKETMPGSFPSLLKKLERAEIKARKAQLMRDAAETEFEKLRATINCFYKNCWNRHCEEKALNPKYTFGDTIC